jgi:signal transduction histidine kinase
VESYDKKKEAVQVSEMEIFKTLVNQLEQELTVYKRASGKPPFSTNLPSVTLQQIALGFQSVLAAVIEEQQVSSTLPTPKQFFDFEPSHPSTDKETLLLIACHEIRTPITVIKGFAELLQANLYKVTRAEYQQKEADSLGQVVPPTLSGEKNLRAIAGILRQVQYLEDLVQYLLDSSDIQQSIPEPQSYHIMHLKEFVQDIVEQHNIISTQHTFTLHNALSEDVADEAKLHYNELGLAQVLNNLINNAVKYSPTASCITIGLAHQAHSREILLWVRDEGYGISIEAQKHLFERFYREDSEKKAQLGGWGIGLYICHQIITRYGGRIWVESEPTKIGSTFYLTLPLLKQTK